MAQSYDIYIHSDQTEESHPTKANDNEKSETKSFGDGFSKTLGAIQNPDSLISQGVGFAAKSVPAIAGAMAVIGLANKTMSSVYNFQTIISGDATKLTTFNNVQAAITSIFKPFSTAIEGFRFNLANALASEKAEQYRELTGDAIINSYGKGV